ncbi:unnamed protein product, partial [Prorocentrum cordatum]
FGSRAAAPRGARPPAAWALARALSRECAVRGHWRRPRRMMRQSATPPEPEQDHWARLVDDALAGVLPQESRAAPAAERPLEPGGPRLPCVAAGGAALPERGAPAAALPAALAALQARESVRKAVSDLSAEVDGILRLQEAATASEVGRLRAEIEALQGRGAGDWGVPGQSAQGWGRDVAASGQEAALDAAVGQRSSSLSLFLKPGSLSAPHGICASSMCSSNATREVTHVGEVKEKGRESNPASVGGAGRQWLSALPSPATASMRMREYSMNMKSKVKDAMNMQERGDEFVLLKKSGWAQRIARSLVFEYFTLFVIALSAVWIAVDVDLNRADDPRDAPLQFQVADQFFCVYFTLEILVRFAAYLSKWHVLRDAWFLFDSGLVVLTVVDTWVVRLILALSDSSQGSDGGTTSMISRLFRLLRLARMARMVRLVTAVPELMIIVRGMAAAARSVILTLFLLTILTYVFAVALRQVTDGTDVGGAYFRSVPAAMASLLLHGTIPDQAPFLETSAKWGDG